MADGVALWDLRRGHPLTFLPCGRNPAVLFEPSGALLTAGPAGVVRRPIDVDLPKPGSVRLAMPQQLPLTGPSSRIAISSDGRVVAKAMGWGGLVWHRDSPQPPLALTPHYDARVIAVSPDGGLVATGSHSGAGAKIWEASTGKPVHELLVNTNNSTNVAFSPDGRRLAASGGLWDTETWRQVRPLESHYATAFSPDGKIFATENGKGIVRLVDPETGREFARLEDPHQDRAGSLCFSHDGAELVATETDSSTIHVWDLRAIRQELREMELDWDLPPYPPADRTSGVQPLTSVVVEPSDLPGWRARGEFLISTGDTAQAAEAFGHAFELASIEAKPMLGRWWTSLLLDAGDIAGFRRACARLRHVLGESSDYWHSAHLSWALLLAPDAVADVGFPIELAKNLVARQDCMPWDYTALAGAQLRNREYESTLRSLDESDRLGRDWLACVANDFLRAIALARLGRVGEAQSVFETGAAYAEKHLTPTPAAPFGEISQPWGFDWYTVRLLRREAAEVLRDAGLDKKSAADPPPPADPKPPVPDEPVPDGPVPDEQVPDEPKAPHFDAGLHGIREK